MSSAGTGYNGKEVVPNGRGGAYVASFWPDGPYGMYDPNAYIGVAQVLAPAGWTNFSEVQTELVNTWYGDVGLAEKTQAVAELGDAPRAAGLEVRAEPLARDRVREPRDGVERELLLRNDAAELLATRRRRSHPEQRLDITTIDLGTGEHGSIVQNWIGMIAAIHGASL